METLFQCNNVNQEFIKFRLEDISFSLEPGSILGVIGRNGCGKTTLLKTLMGIYDTKNCEEISILDHSLIRTPKEFHKRIAYVLNETPFLGNFSAVTNGKMFGKYYDSFDQGKYEKLLEQYEIAKDIGKYNTVKQGKENIKKLGYLSQGQMIRQQLAFALSYDANLYFMDEPTGNLDVEFRDEFYDTIRSLVTKENVSVIYASHLIEEMEQFADYILWLRENDGVGKIFFYGSIDELRERFRILEQQELIDTLPKECIVGGNISEYHGEVLVDLEKLGQEQKYINAMRYPDLKEIMYYVEKGEVQKDD